MNEKGFNYSEKYKRDDFKQAAKMVDYCPNIIKEGDRTLCIR